jgi:hypothetical protein
MSASCPPAAHRGNYSVAQSLISTLLQVSHTELMRLWTVNPAVQDSIEVHVATEQRIARTLDHHSQESQ